MDAKPLLKEAIQAETGLEIDPTKPLVGFIGRLEEQKGSDILTAAIPEFIGEDVQIIVLVSSSWLLSRLDMSPPFVSFSDLGQKTDCVYHLLFRELEKKLWRSKSKNLKSNTQEKLSEWQSLMPLWPIW